MQILEFFRQFRLGGYAIFDLAAAFLGMYLLSPLLTGTFLKLKIIIPKKNWLFLALPIGIIVHLLAGNMTLMTRSFIDIHGHYALKIIIIGLLLFGIRGIRKVKN